jgi:hypothetical protein
MLDNDREHPNGMERGADLWICACVPIPSMAGSPPKAAAMTVKMLARRRSAFCKGDPWMSRQRFGGQRLALLDGEAQRLKGLYALPGGDKLEHADEVRDHREAAPSGRDRLF